MKTLVALPLFLLLTPVWAYISYEIMMSITFMELGMFLFWAYFPLLVFSVLWAK